MSKDNMNILITFLSAKRNAFGGMERSIYSLIKGFEYHKCNVYVYTATVENNESVEDRFIYSKYLINTFPKDDNLIDQSILRNYKENENEIKEEILFVIKDKCIDYILAVDQLWGVISCIDIFNEIKCKVGIVYHMFLQEDIIVKTLQMPFTNYFAVSNDVRDRIQKLNKSGKVIDLLYNTYNEEVFYPTNITKQKKIFCNTRLAENKGVEYLLEAFKKFHIEFGEYELILCGGDFYFGNRTKIFSFINAFLKSNPELRNFVRILGDLNWSQIPALIQESTMVIIPSGYESFGIAALEAIACETALVATNTGNLPELIEDAGILIPFADVEMLYCAMKEIIINSDLTDDLIQNCKKVKTKYEAKAVSKKFLKIVGAYHIK